MNRIAALSILTIFGSSFLLLSTPVQSTVLVECKPGTHVYLNTELRGRCNEQGRFILQNLDRAKEYQLRLQNGDDTLKTKIPPTKEQNMMITAHLQSGVIEKKMTTLEIKGITRLGCESTSTVPKTGRDLQPQLSHIAIPAFSETTAVSNSFGSFSFTKEEEPSQSPKTLVVHKTAEKNQHMPQSEVLNVANQPTQAIEKDTTQRISTSNNGVSTLAKLKSRVSTKLRSLTVNPFKGSLNKVTQKIHSLTTTVSQASSALSDKMSNTWNSLYQRIAGKKKKDPSTIMSGREVLAKIFVDDRWIMADVEEETEKTNQAIADQHFSENNYLMALKHYNLALQETKDNAQLLVKRSETFIELQQLDLALTDLQQAMENATGREKQKISRLVAKLTYTRGIAAFTEGNLELAEKDLVEAIKLQPKIDKKLKYRSKLYAAMRAAK